MTRSKILIFSSMAVLLTYAILVSGLWADGRERAIRPLGPSFAGAGFQSQCTKRHSGRPALLVL